MASLPSLDVVIPAFNAEGFLERAVESVFATGYPGISVTIVDDGSRDGTRRLAEVICRNSNGSCRFLCHPDGGNHGVSASRNLGIAATSSEWVAFLDADDLYLPNRFDAFRSLLGKDEAFDAVYGMAEIRGDEAGRMPSPGSAGNLFGIDRSLDGDALLRELLLGRCWATSAITIRRDLLRRTGLFDIRKRIAEDCDVWFRMASAGKIVAGSLDRPISVYWRHAANTYQYDLVHRVAMLHAMLDSWRWARRSGASGQVLNTFADAVPAYATRSLVATREAGRTRVAWQLLFQMARSCQIQYLLRTQTLRQVLGLLRSEYRRLAGMLSPE